MISNNFVSKNLLDNEVIKYKGKLHKIMYLESVVMFLLLTLSMLLQMSVLIKFLIFFVFLYVSLDTFLTILTTEIVITNQRVLMKSGIITRQVAEIQLFRIESVNIYQSFLGKILDYGSIDIKGVGMGNEIINNIEDPVQFRNELYRNNQER